MGLLGEHFASEGQNRHSEWLRQQRWFIKARHDHQRREEIADKAENGVVSIAVDMVIATQSQIKAFEVKLDSYDQATVVALMENLDALDAVTEQISAMLAQAYVMDDGRRVFKTEDGTQLFDEHGLEVSQEELDPQMIDDTRPTWEAFSGALATEEALKAERADILEYQEQVDAAREQIAEGNISEADLEALDADLLDAMPDAVRAHVADLEPATPAPNLKAGFTATAAAPQMQNAEASAPAPAPFQ